MLSLSGWLGDWLVIYLCQSGRLDSYTWLEMCPTVCLPDYSFIRAAGSLADGEWLAAGWLDPMWHGVTEYVWSGASDSPQPCSAAWREGNGLMNPARLQLRQGNGEPYAAYWVLTVLTAGRGSTRSSFSVSPCQDSHYANALLRLYTPKSWVRHGRASSDGISHR